MVQSAIVRVRGKHCLQWDIDSALKRGLSLFLGKQLVAFEVIQGQPILPLRQMALWASVAQKAMRSVAIFDAKREFLSIWQCEDVAFFMDACNASETLRLARTCMDSGIKVAIVCGAKDVYRAQLPFNDPLLSAAWLGFELEEACQWFQTAPCTESLLPAWNANDIGDYCPYFVPVSLAYDKNGVQIARTPEDIVSEIRALKKLGVLSAQKKVIFDSPFDSEAKAHETILRIAHRLVTEEISWAAYLPTITDCREIALLRRAGLFLASFGKSMNFNTMMHDGVRRILSAKCLDAFKSRGIIVHASLTIGLPLQNRAFADYMTTLEAKHFLNSSVDLPEIQLETPYPETKLFRECLKNGHLTDFDWNHYDGAHVVCQIQGDSRAPAALESEVKRMQNAACSSSERFMRLFKPTLGYLKMCCSSALPLSESTALRFVLSSSLRNASDSNANVPMPRLQSMTLVGKIIAQNL